MRKRRPAILRFWKHVTLDGDHILWTGNVNSDGYPTIWGDNDKAVLVHRLVYETLVEPILPGNEVDHACPCGRLRCMTPERLQQVTPTQNRELQTTRARARKAAP